MMANLRYQLISQTVGNIPLSIQGLGLSADVPTLQGATLLEEGGGLTTWASDQPMLWPVSIACLARAEVMEFP